MLEFYDEVEETRDAAEAIAGALLESEDETDEVILLPFAMSRGVDLLKSLPATDLIFRFFYRTQK